MQMFREIATFTITAFALQALAPPSRAESMLGESMRGNSSEKAPGVEDLVRQALTHSPTLAAAQARQASAQEQVAPAGALPDPMVGVMYQSIGVPWRRTLRNTRTQLNEKESKP